MPKVFKQNQKINVIEYGSLTQGTVSFNDIKALVLGYCKKLLRA